MSIQPRKRFAQHWLRSDIALNNIMEAAQLTKSDRILEIGPGTGILTRLLLPTVQSVVAIEIDRDLCKKLAKSLGKEDNFLLLQGDILSLDLDSHLTNFPAFAHPNKVVANIPYNITGPILEYLLGTLTQPAPKTYDLIVLLVQKEVAERLIAHPKTKAYGALSIRIQYLAACEWVCDVPAQAFYPPPKVDSAVVRICPQTYSIEATNPKQFDTLLKLGFANRRKMLRNNLKEVIEGDLLNQLLEEIGSHPQARAEELSLHQWLTLSNQVILM